MPNLSINAAAKAAGVSAQSVRNWLKSEPTLKKLTRKGKRGTEVTPAGLEELKKIAERRRAAAGPGLSAAWKAVKGGKRKAKKRRNTTTGKAGKAKVAGRKGRKTRSYPGLEKARAARSAKAKERREAKPAAAQTTGLDLDEALGKVRDAMSVAVNEATAGVKKVMIGVLEEQRAVIERALRALRE